MKRKLYLDIALLVVILGVFGVFVFMQHAPATDTPTQEATTGCCGESVVKGETPQANAGSCCGTSAAETTQSNNVLQQGHPQEATETGKAPTQTLQNEGGCGCGS